MKVALLNNINNCFFSIARYLRDAKIDAHLFLEFDGLKHYYPQDDTFEDVAQKEWIHALPIKSKFEKYFSPYSKPLKGLFDEFDIIISCGYSPSFLKSSGYNPDIFIAYGQDVREFPFKSIKKPNSKQSNFEFWLKAIVESKLKLFQKKAIQNTRVNIIYAPIDFMIKPIEKLGIDFINEQMPMLYNKESVSNIRLEEFVDTKYLQKLDNSIFVVFNHSRQLWSTNNNNLPDFDKYLGIKRNDKVINAFAKFIKITKLQNPLLVLFEYGADVQDSKQLIKDLDIENNVLWFPKSSRKIIMLLLKKYATFGTDQYRENVSDGLSGTAYEVISSEVPLLAHHTYKDLPENRWYLESPLIEVLSVDDMLNVFIDYEKNPLKYKQIGKESKIWFDKYLGQGLADKYIEMIKLMSENKNLTQKDNIIKEIFDK